MNNSEEMANSGSRTIREPKPVRKKRRPLISGFIWLGLGIFGVVGQQGYLPDMDIEHLIPVLIIIVGIAFILGSLARGRAAHKNN